MSVMPTALELALFHTLVRQYRPTSNYLKILVLVFLSSSWLFWSTGLMPFSTLNRTNKNHEKMTVCMCQKKVIYLSLIKKDNTIMYFQT